MAAVLPPPLPADVVACTFQVSGPRSSVAEFQPPVRTGSAASSSTAAPDGASTYGGRPGLPPPLPVNTERRPHSGDISEGPSESSAIREETEDDDFQNSIPHLERFYEQMAAKARVPCHPGHSGSASWVLSLARSYRRLSKDKRRRGKLKSLMQTVAQAGPAASGTGLSSGLPCGFREYSGWSSNTDDSGYEAGYETDADESELSEWESGTSRRGHKRKLDALVHLTMRLNFAESSDFSEESGAPALMKQAHATDTESASTREMQDGGASSSMTQMPPPKVTRALGTRPAGLRLSLPGASASSCNGGLGNTTLVSAAVGGSSASPGLTMGTSPLPTARTAAMVLPAFMPAPSLPESVLQAADSEFEGTRVMDVS